MRNLILICVLFLLFIVNCSEKTGIKNPLKSVTYKNDYSGTYKELSGKMFLVLNKDNSCFMRVTGMFGDTNLQCTFETSGNRIKIALRDQFQRDKINNLAGTIEGNEIAFADSRFIKL